MMFDFISPTDQRRRLSITGTFNFRDVGGYPAGASWTRSGILYRSDALAELTPEDIARLQELGIRTVVDLRDLDETKVNPDAIAGWDVEYHRIPLFNDMLVTMNHHAVISLEDHYELLMGRFLGQTLKVLELLSQPEKLPAVVHCAAGKDRTGFLMAMILGVLQVNRRWILDDYAASGVFLGDEFAAKIRALYLRDGFPASMSREPTSAPREIMERVFTRIETEHGAVEAFLTASGARKEMLAQLRLAILAP